MNSRKLHGYTMEVTEKQDEFEIKVTTPRGNVHYTYTRLRCFAWKNAVALVEEYRTGIRK